MDSLPPHTSRNGVLTRLQASKERNYVSMEVDENHTDDLSRFIQANVHASSNEVGESNFGTLGQRCHSDSALYSCNGKMNASMENTCMSDIRSEMTELNTQLDHTTGRLHEAEYELIQTKTELRNTMKQLIETRDECSTCEEQNKSLKLQVTSIENELSQSRRENSKLQGELSLAMMGIENLKHETNRRQLQHMSMQVNGSSAHGANEYMNITLFATSYDYNHGRTCTTAGSMINNLADPSQ